LSPMKLYYSSGSCSTSCHIVLEESGLKYEAIEVDFDNASDPNLALVAKMNPLGTLPILITDDGKQLDQNLAIQVYVADKAADKKLLPPAGTMERAEALNWLSFVAADLHKGVGALFSVSMISPDTAIQSVVRKSMLERANGYLSYLDSKLAGKEYLMGKNFSPADAYAFVVTGWTKWLEVPLTPYKNIEAYMARIAARPAVAKVLKEEGLL
jgi:glutathione S-transferase